MKNVVIDFKKTHLGGNMKGGDPGSWCPSVWKYIIEKYNIKTAMDVGSGLGYASKFLNEQGVETTALDGLEYNITNSVHPTTILFDLTEGFVENKVDFVNCIEVVEHIKEKYIHNLLDTLSQGNYILITHAIPGQKGHHHVNCQPSEYWIKHLESYGYIFLENESEYIRKLAKEDGAVHVSRNGLFFSKLNLEN
jgi:cyclopropane fatty-acyl-phospholipid synthase-like methyltransferase